MFLQDRQRLFGQAASRIVLGRLLPIFFDVFLMILHHRLREGPVEGSTGKNLELGIGRFCTDARTRRRGHPSSPATCSALVLWSPWSFTSIAPYCLIASLCPFSWARLPKSTSAMSPWMADEINFWLALSTGFDFASAPVAANAPASATATIAVVLLIIAPKVPFACFVYGEASAIKTAGVQCLFLVGLLEHISAFNRP